MKVLIMCEGPNELAVIEMLLDANLLKFERDDLLNLMPFHARQIQKSPTVKTALNLYPGPVEVLRIGDALTDKLMIPKDYQDQITSVQKYCTKPELEMLLIIAEGLVHDFEKTKSQISPKSFAKQKIKCGKEPYKNQTQFYYDFFQKNIDLLVHSIREYKRLKGKTHKADEGTLADLLR